MKYVLIFLLQFIFVSIWAQQSYSVFVYDKNTNKEVPVKDFKQTDSTISINFDNKEIIFDVDRESLDFKYIYLYIDTIDNADNVPYVLDVRSDFYTNGRGVPDSIKHFHVLRNLDWGLRNPKNAFRWKNFIGLDGESKDIFIGANIGHAYSGLLVGASLKWIAYSYVDIWGDGFFILTANLEYSAIMSGPYTGAREFGVGLRNTSIIPIGLQYNRIYLNNTFSSNIRPEIGIDIGLFSIIYGYNIGLTNNHNLVSKDRHYFKVGIGFNIGNPIFEHRRKFPYFID